MFHVMLSHYQFCITFYTAPPAPMAAITKNTSKKHVISAKKSNKLPIFSRTGANVIRALVFYLIFYQIAKQRTISNLNFNFSGNKECFPFYLTPPSFHQEMPKGKTGMPPGPMHIYLNVNMLIREKNTHFKTNSSSALNS